MSDDGDASFRRRRRRDGDAPDDLTERGPADSYTDEPQAGDGGADWLESQLDDGEVDRTQAIPVTDAGEQSTPSRGEGPTPDLTPWWRDSAPSPVANDAADRAAGNDAADTGLIPSDITDAEQSDGTAPRRRSTFQPFTPAEPQAAAVEPEPEPKSEPALKTTEVPVESEPIVSELVAPSEATPPLFKPRPDSDRPWVTKPLDGPVRSGDGSVDHSAEADRESAPTVVSDDSDSSNSDSNDSALNNSDLNDSAPFTWSLTPNNELDPIVHKTASPAGSAGPSASVAPAAAFAASVVPPVLPLGRDAELTDESSAHTGSIDESTVNEGSIDESTVDGGTVDEGTVDEPSSDETLVPESLVNEEIIDAELVDEESDGIDDVQPIPATAAGKASSPTATFDTEDVDSLAFLIELEAATAATVAINATDSTDANAPAATEPFGFDGFSDDAHIATNEPVSGRRAGSMGTGTPAAAFAADTATALVPPVPPGTNDSASASPERSGRPPLPPYVKWIALGLAAVLVLVGLFFLGTRLPGLFGGEPAAAPTPSTTESATPTETVTPTPTAPPAEVVTVGPVPPGEHKWTALLGGECLEPFSTPWAENFTVVDCATPHKAQMVFTAPVTSDPAAPYPGEAEIASQIALWCSAPGVLDAAAAGAFTDLQVQGTYPVNEEQWADGERNYFCFISRSTGEPLTGTLAVAQPAP
ncbi:hypothetical protein [Mycetocola zhadangensis]|uniref:Septum formation-related domain-containing protein n=1 Tax=Mycetocola zhadangensis TaxID=1164595 RepID=A0A3L7J221_9MICO|nr:hypothetical protein [Mycetocola zhadangensis]RLQ84459.1 hypothetical protein D9V28_09740 [Mycetocola zhadangensis]GGE92808.1 hypothetical protein GCM10011313_14720 [Mycetocola zhadangensis]